MNKRWAIISVISLFFLPAAHGLEPGEAFTTIMGIPLGARLSEIVRKLGETKIVESGDAATSQAVACYQVSSNEVIEFGQGELDHFYVLRVVQSDDAKKCTPLKFRSIEVSGIKLGMSKSDVQNVLGKPFASTASSLSYSYSRTRKLTAEEMRGHGDPESNEKPWDVSTDISISARFLNSKLIQFLVSKTEST